MNKQVIFINQPFYNNPDKWVYVVPDEEIKKTEDNFTKDGCVKLNLKAWELRRFTEQELIDLYHNEAVERGIKEFRIIQDLFGNIYIQPL